jgi:hypothetical protein
VNKLCSNCFKIKKGEEVYDLTQKYRLILDMVTHNVNQCLERGGLDVSPEKNTWPSASYSGMHEYLRGGKHSKGGHHTMVVGAKAGWIYAWTPRYSLYKKVPHFTQESPIEVMCLCKISIILCMVGTRPLVVTIKEWTE